MIGIFIRRPVLASVLSIVIVLLGLLSLRDPNLAAGEAHMMIGTLLLVPSLALFLAVVWTLNRLVDDEPSTGGTPA